MYSAIGLTAALAIVAITATVTQTEPTRPNQAAATHAVAADGSADHVSIQAAIEAAQPGDTITVAPGTYAEPIIVDKDITLIGDGPREDIVISFSDGETPTVSLVDTTATLSGLTVTGEDSQVWISGGSPRIENVLFDRVGRPNRENTELFALSLVVDDRAHAEVIGNTFLAGGAIRVVGKAWPLIEGNELIDGPHIGLDDPGPGTVIRGNDIAGSVYSGIGIGSTGDPLVEDNVIRDAAKNGIVGWGSGDGFAPTIRRNHLSGHGIGISLPARTMGTVEGNVLQGNRVGISVRSDVRVAGNEITGDGTGIMVVANGSPTISGNSIDVAGRGIVISGGSSPVVEGNDICGGVTAIFVAAEAAPVLGANDTC